MVLTVSLIIYLLSAIYAFYNEKSGHFITFGTKHLDNSQSLENNIR